MTNFSDYLLFVLVCLLFVSVIIFWGYRIVCKAKPNSSWLICSIPYWLGGYCVALCLNIPYTLFSPYGIWNDICFYGIFAVLSVCALMLIVCYVSIIVKKQWGNVGRMTGLLLLLIVCSIVIFTIAGMAAGLEDHFGKRHPIPADLSYYEPKNGYFQTHDLQIEQIARERKIYIAGNWNGYDYAIWVPALEEDGILTLRAYEAVTNDRLTLRSYKGDIEVSASDEDFVHICYDRVAFDNGIPEEPYAARIELWFIPKNEAHKERMLSSAIYKVQGWSR